MMKNIATKETPVSTLLMQAVRQVSLAIEQMGLALSSHIDSSFSFSISESQAVKLSDGILLRAQQTASLVDAAIGNGDDRSILNAIRSYLTCALGDVAELKAIRSSAFDPEIKATLESLIAQVSARLGFAPLIDGKDHVELEGQLYAWCEAYGTYRTQLDNGGYKHLMASELSNAQSLA